MSRVRLHVIEQMIPATFERLQLFPRDERAEVGAASLHHLQPRVSSLVKDDLHIAGQFRLLLRREGEIHLESNQSALSPLGRARPAAEVMLARSKKCICGLNREGGVCAVCYLSPPEIRSFSSRLM